MSLNLSSVGGAASGSQLAAISQGSPGAQAPRGHGGDEKDMRKQFDTFVGETFYGQMLSSMRKTVGKAAYFDGGRAEETFRGQLDQILSQKMTEASGGSFSGPMFELFKHQIS